MEQKSHNTLSSEVKRRHDIGNVGRIGFVRMEWLITRKPHWGETSLSAIITWPNERVAELTINTSYNCLHVPCRILRPNANGVVRVICVPDILEPREIIPAECTMSLPILLRHLRNVRLVKNEQPPEEGALTCECGMNPGQRKDHGFGFWVVEVQSKSRVVEIRDQIECVLIEMEPFFLPA